MRYDVGIVPYRDSSALLGMTGENSSPIRLGRVTIPPSACLNQMKKHFVFSFNSKILSYFAILRRKRATGTFSTLGPFRDPAKSEILRERGATPLKMKIKACFNLSKNAVIATTFVHFIHKKNAFLVIIFLPILLTFKCGCVRMFLK